RRSASALSSASAPIGAATGSFRGMRFSMNKRFLFTLALAACAPASAVPSNPPPAPVPPPAAPAAAPPAPSPTAETAESAKPPEPTPEEKAKEVARALLEKDRARFEAEQASEATRWTPELHAAARAVADKSYPSGHAAMLAVLASKHRRPASPNRDADRHPV